MRGRASDSLSPHQAQSKCAPLIIRTEDLSAARSHMSYAQKLRLPQAQDREATESYLRISLSLSLSPPLPSFYPVNTRCSPSRRSNAIKPPPLSLLLFRRYIFCSHRERSAGRWFELRARMVFLIYLSSVYPRNGVRPPSPLVPPVQNRSPREFVDYNKCVCSSRRYRTSSGFLLIPLSSFPSSLSALSSPRFSPLALYPSLAAGFRYPAAAAAVAAARKKDGTDGMK